MLPILDGAQVVSFRENGFLAPLQIFDMAEVGAIRMAIEEHLSGAAKSQVFELTDPIEILNIGQAPESPEFVYNDSGKSVEVTNFGFLFNLWRRDPRFLKIGTEERFARIAEQLLGVDEVLLFEDNVIVKLAHTKYLPWHQDYSYWPLAEPSAVTFWIALHDINSTNGAMEVSPGTQRLGERLPVAFGDEEPFMVKEWPHVPPVPRNPAAEGYPIVTYNLHAGECGVHDALIWHGSTANRTDSSRYVLVLRYVASGTLWAGPSRMAYDDIGCAPGERLNGHHLPVAGKR
jgi:hypothetical protein